MVLGLCTLVLVALNSLVVLGYSLGFKMPLSMKFYFDQEGNMPSYFSSLLLLAVAVVASLIAAQKRQENDTFAVQWTGLAVVFLALSVDEAVSFHEVLIEPLLNAYHLSGVLRFPWVLAGGAFTAVFGVLYLKFFLALSPTMKWLFAASGIVYVTGVLGMEMLGGYLFVGFNDFSESSLPYMLAMTIEETLEMSGVLLFLYTLLRYVRGYMPRLTVGIQ